MLNDEAVVQAVDHSVLGVEAQQDAAAGPVVFLGFAFTEKLNSSASGSSSGSAVPS
jgi:hypothetical protein